MLQRLTVPDPQQTYTPTSWLHEHRDHTDDLARTLKLAEGYTNELGSHYIGTEHLLLAMHEPLIGGLTLRSLDLESDTLVSPVLEVIGRGTPQNGERGFVDRSVTCLEIATAEARHEQVDSGHLLVALAQEGEGAAAELLNLHLEDPIATLKKATRLIRARQA